MWNREDMKDNRPADATKDTRVATVGNSVLIKGDVSGSEDLTIDGRVEGRIDLPNHSLTIGPNATIQANINAKTATLFGKVVGTVNVTDKLDIRKTASVEGTVTCGRMSVQEGAHLSGKVQTGQRKSSNESGKPVLVNVA